MLRDLPIEGVAQRMGMEVTRHKALCPFHDDHHASLSFNVRKNTYRCFVCGEHGGTIDLVMRALHLGFKEACKWLDGGLLVSSFKFQVSGGNNLEHETWNLKPMAFDAKRYERFFERPWLSEEAKRFLFEERKLDPRVVRWCRLTSWRDKQGVNWLQIPYYDREGRLVGIQNRNLDWFKEFKVSSADVFRQIKFIQRCSKPFRRSSARHSEQVPSALALQFKVSSADVASARHSEQVPSALALRNVQEVQGVPRFKFPRGSECGIYNLPVLNRLHEGEELWITEGASDCWAMLSAGHKAIAIPSATLLKPKDLNQLSTLHSQLSTPFHMAPDRDEPGERLFLQLQSLLPNLTHHQLPKGCKDYSDYYLSIVSPPAAEIQ